MSKKEAIIEAARELFTKYGYKKVSMDEIASEANVTKKTIYSYFKDKDSMFMYFIDEELDKIKDYLEKIKHNNLSFVENVASEIYQILIFRKNSVLISNVSKEAKNNNAVQCQKFLKSYDDSILNYIEEKIKEEIELGNIKKCDAHLLAFVIYKIFLSIMFEYDDSIDEEKVTKEITSILKDGILN
jgi:AcrR family transcriptional regulator